MLEIEHRLPKVAADFNIFYTDRTGKKEEHYLYSGEVPREIMDAYQQVIGDGKARVAVSVDFAVKDFGTGAGASVTVSLSCGQDTANINAAIQLAQQTAQYYAAQFQSQGAQQAKALEAAQKTGTQGRPNYGG